MGRIDIGAFSFNEVVFRSKKPRTASPAGIKETEKRKMLQNGAKYG
jgi:hypothetical protein